MSERYKKLYHLPHRLHAANAPVLVESGALLQEQPAGPLLCQLCFRSIQDRAIKGLRAELQLLDDAGMPLGHRVDHRYQDLDLKREEACGRDSALVLPFDSAASFTVRVTQVSFADGEVWSGEDADWLPLPDQLPLEAGCEPGQELERLRRRLGQGADYAPLQTEELWFCACGAVNHSIESRCHRCRRRRSLLFGREGAARDPEELEEARFHAGPGSEAPSPKLRRGFLIGAGSLALLALVTALLLPTLKRPAAAPAAESSPAPTAIPVAAQAAPPAKAEPTAAAEPEDPLSPAYAQALSLKEEADYAPPEDAPELYEQAALAFEALGDYADSPALAAACREQLAVQREALLRSDYDRALALLDQGRYAEARQAFLALGDYEDSGQMAMEAIYRKGAALYRFLDSHRLRGVTALLRTEPGEESLVALPREQLLELGSQGIRELESCFGADPVRFVAEGEEGSPAEPLEEAAAKLLLPLGDYRDSAELAAQLPEMRDRSYEFYALCSAGQLEEARDWLLAWQRPFEDRELWMEWLERFLPYCGEWSFSTGDPSLVPSIGGLSEKPDLIRCRVLLTPEKVTLCFLLNEGDETGPMLYADPDDTRFISGMSATQYFAQINMGGSLTVNKLQDGMNIGGVEYVR